MREKFLMKIYIDTSSNQKTIVRVGEAKIIKHNNVWRSQIVLPMIANMLQKQGSTLSDISEIEVVDGICLPAGRQGSFTGLRVGVTIANALGYALKIPVNGKNVDKLEIVEPVYQ